MMPEPDSPKAIESALDAAETLTTVDLFANQLQASTNLFRGDLKRYSVSHMAINSFLHNKGSVRLAGDETIFVYMQGDKQGTADAVKAVFKDELVQTFSDAQIADLRTAIIAFPDVVVPILCKAYSHLNGQWLIAVWLAKAAAHNPLVLQTLVTIDAPSALVERIIESVELFSTQSLVEVLQRLPEEYAKPILSKNKVLLQGKFISEAQPEVLSGVQALLESPKMDSLDLETRSQTLLACWWFGNSNKLSLELFKIFRTDPNRLITMAGTMLDKMKSQRLHDRVVRELSFATNESRVETLLNEREKFHKRRAQIQAVVEKRPHMDALPMCKNPVMDLLSWDLTSDAIEKLAKCHTPQEVCSLFGEIDEHLEKPFLDLFSTLWCWHDLPTAVALDFASRCNFPDFPAELIEQKIGKEPKIYNILRHRDFTFMIIQRPDAFALLLSKPEFRKALFRCLCDYLENWKTDNKPDSQRRNFRGNASIDILTFLARKNAIDAAKFFYYLMEQPEFLTYAEEHAEHIVEVLYEIHFAPLLYPKPPKDQEATPMPERFLVTGHVKQVCTLNVTVENVPPAIQQSTLDLIERLEKMLQRQAAPDTREIDKLQQDFATVEKNCTALLSQQSIRCRIGAVLGIKVSAPLPKQFVVMREILQDLYNCKKDNLLWEDVLRQFQAKGYMRLGQSEDRGTKTFSLPFLHLVKTKIKRSESITTIALRRRSLMPTVAERKELISKTLAVVTAKRRGENFERRRTFVKYSLAGLGLASLAGGSLYLINQTGKGMLRHTTVPGEEPLSPSVTSLEENPREVGTLSKALQGEDQYLVLGYYDRELPETFTRVPMDTATAEAWHKLGPAVSVAGEDILLTLHHLAPESTLCLPARGLRKAHNLAGHPPNQPELVARADGTFGIPKDVSINGGGSVSFVLEPKKTLVDPSTSLNELRTRLPNVLRPLLKTTMSETALPPELQKAIQHARSLPAVAAAECLRQSVSNFLTYDDSVGPVYEQFLQTPRQTIPGKNPYIEFICAQKRGVCGQSERLLFEMLRMAGIPCAAQSCYWAQEKNITTNDLHIVPVAILPGPNGTLMRVPIEGTPPGSNKPLKKKHDETEKPENQVHELELQLPEPKPEPNPTPALETDGKIIEQFASEEGIHSVVGVAPLDIVAFAAGAGAYYYSRRRKKSENSSTSLAPKKATPGIPETTEAQKQIEVGQAFVSSFMQAASQKTSIQLDREEATALLDHIFRVVEASCPQYLKAMYLPEIFIDANFRAHLMKELPHFSLQQQSVVQWLIRTGEDQERKILEELERESAD